MKAFITSFIVLIVITVTAAVSLNAVDLSAGNVFSSDRGVRL